MPTWAQDESITDFRRRVESWRLLAEKSKLFDEEVAAFTLVTSLGSNRKMLKEKLEVLPVEERKSIVHVLEECECQPGTWRAITTEDTQKQGLRGFTQEATFVTKSNGMIERTCNPDTCMCNPGTCHYECVKLTGKTTGHCTRDQSQYAAWKCDCDALIYVYDKTTR
eukprot:g6575.t1